jgi:predicted ATPase/DNA-binding SARP family transcriptional activator
MDFRILGPLEVVSDGETLDLGGQKQRALLAVLLVNANRVVDRDRLINALWEEEAPDTVQKALQVYVSQLRKILGRDRVVTQAPGYLLRVEADELDLERFRTFAEEGRLDEALALWRGPALSEFAYQRFAQTEIARLEELHLTCLENRIERDLARGQHAALVGELESLVKAHPLRERLRSQLMLALYRSGRQAEALEAYQQARTALVDELGIEPGRPLRDLHQAILNQDPGLDLAPTMQDATHLTHEPARRPRAPSGTVTLLFADVEGSTRLVHALGGERYRSVRTRARELVRSASAAHAGYEVDWAGDGVFLAFERARDAAAAAVELQRSLAAEPWPPEETLRMRIGIHTGEPEVTEEGYVGIDVHVAARICSSAHGGQIVVSRSAREFAGEGGDEAFTFRPLGSHRLRDVASPLPLYQLVAPGLEEAFPPLQTLAGATLPALHHRLVGRSRDLAEIEALIARPDVRLVTITGPGGAGKSRLALEVAGAAAVVRPVHLVGLAPISDPDLVPAAIARTLGVRETAGRSLVESIAETLAHTDALLFLDNLEHLTPAARHVSELLQRAPGVDILTTSRAPLRLSGEHIVPLAPLDVEDAATFFIELASARGVVLREDAKPSVFEICRRLDGLPLAIELVAARLAVLPPARILKAIEEGLALHMEGPVDLPERQRTLRATIEWSYGLLDERQRELLGALSVFPGGCSLDDAQALAEANGSFLADLEALVGWSLIRSDVSDGDVRLSMLETVREDAEARLAAAGKLESLKERHAERFLELARAAETELAGPSQAEWLERLELELDNIRAALDWCFASGRVEDALRAISALERFWRAHGHVSEARRWLALGLGLAEGVAREVRARALWTAAHEAMMQSDYPAAIPQLEEALGLFRELEDDRYTVFALCELARALASQDKVDDAQRAAEDALAIAESVADERAASAVLDTLAMVAGYREEHPHAQELSEQSLALRRSLGDPHLVASSANTLGLAAMRAGDLDTAERAFEECLQLANELGEGVLTAAALCSLGEINLYRQLSAPAAERLLAALVLYRELGDERDCAECLHALGGTAALKGAWLVSAQLWGAADGLRQHAGAAPTPEEKAIDQRFASAVANELGEPEFARARSEGRSLPLSEIETIARGLVERTEPSNLATTGGRAKGGFDAGLRL